MRNKVVLGGDSSTLPRSWSFQVRGIREWGGQGTELATYLALSPRGDLSASLCKPSGCICPSFSERACSRHPELPDLSNQRWSKVGTRSWPALSAGGRKRKRFSPACREHWPVLGRKSILPLRLLCLEDQGIQPQGEYTSGRVLGKKSLKMHFQSELEPLFLDPGCSSARCVSEGFGSGQRDPWALRPWVNHSLLQACLLVCENGSTKRTEGLPLGA